MNSIVKIYITSLLILISFSFGFSQNKSLSKEAFEKGKAEAAENLKNERYVFKAWGLTSTNIYSWQSEEEIYNSILKDTYKITFEWIGGCFVDEETAQYAEAYNEVMKAGIEAKYGIGILEKVKKQAAVEYESKYGEKQREFDKNFEERLKFLESLPKPKVLELRKPNP
jgi:hypothetical protein